VPPARAQSAVVDPFAGESNMGPSTERYEDTELRRGVPPPAAARPVGALPPEQNPDDIGGRPGDRRRLTDEQVLAMLKAQLADLGEDEHGAGGTAEAQLRNEIALLEARIAKKGAVQTAGPTPPGVKTIQSGALATAETDPWEGAVADASSQNATMGVRGALDEGEQQPATARKTLGERYRERVKGIPSDIKGDLSDEQKAQMQLDFFLNLLARGGQRGQGFLENVGASGLDVSGKVTAARDKNITNRRADAATKRDEAFREVGFEEKDEDNTRDQQRLGLDKRRLEILERQVKQGAWKVVDNAETGTYTIIDHDGKARDTGVKIDRSSKEPPEVRLLKHLRENPKDIELLKQLRTKEKDDSDQIVEAATKLLQNDLTGRMTPDQALSSARRIVEGAKGGGQAMPSKPDPKANKGRTISGPDGRFKSDGEKWVKIP
jgi:hypothetical protein